MPREVASPAVPEESVVCAEDLAQPTTYVEVGAPSSGEQFPDVSFEAVALCHDPESVTRSGDAELRNSGDEWRADLTRMAAETDYDHPETYTRPLSERTTGLLPFLNQSAPQGNEVSTLPACLTEKPEHPPKRSTFVRKCIPKDSKDQLDSSQHPNACSDGDEPRMRCA